MNIWGGGGGGVHAHLCNDIICFILIGTHPGIFNFPK